MSAVLPSGFKLDQPSGQQSGAPAAAAGLPAGFTLDQPAATQPAAVDGGTWMPPPLPAGRTKPWSDLELQILKGSGAGSTAPATDGGQWTGVGAAARGFTNPFGISDEIGGAINGILDWAGINPAGGGDGTFTGGYNRFVTKARALDNAAADQQPWLYGGGQLLSGAAITGLGALSSAGQRALGITGDTLLGRIGASGLSGAGIGGATGYASGEGDVANRIGSAETGAITGGLLGGAAPVVGAVAGKTVGAASRAADWLRGMLPGSDEPLTQAAQILGHRGEEPIAIAKSPYTTAAQTLATALKDNPLAAGVAAQDPGALLAEAGPGFTQTAGAIAAQPGEGGPLLRAATAQRLGGATDRITDALDQTLGPERDVLQTESDISQVQSARAKPLYDALRDQPVTMTPNLNFVLGTKQGQSALAKASDLAETFGHPIDPTNPTVGGMDYVKRALDDQISKSITAGTTAKTAGLQNLRNRLVSEIDQQTLMNTGNQSFPGLGVGPNQQVSLYGLARQAWAGPAAVKDALEAGQSAFSKDQSPTAMRAALADMTQSERNAYVVGARSQIAQNMGTARSDPQGAINTFTKGWNREKLQSLIGSDHAQTLLDAIERERNLKAFGTEVTGGSQTAARQAAQAALQRKSWISRGIGQARIVFGIGKAEGLERLGALRAVEGLLGSHDEVRNEQVASIIARGLVMHGAEKTQLIQALQAGLERMSATQRRSSGAAALVRALSSTAAVPATAAITQQVNRQDQAR